MVNIYNDGVSLSRTLAEMDNTISNIEEDNFMHDVIEKIRVRLSDDLKDLDNIDWGKDDEAED